MRPTLATAACLAAALATAQAFAASPEPPAFRKGSWHFVRTLDLIVGGTSHRLSRRETTACVDPTVAMKAMWSSPSIGSCVSTAPERDGDRYVFANRCDYLGPAKTTIAVQDETAYVETDELKGTLPKVDTVVARRIGDCPDGAAKAPDRKPPRTRRPS